MGRFFNLENPVWRFIGNLADLFLLSVCWYLCCIPVITIGSATTAVYYVTLKLACGKEGYTLSSFLHAFRDNFKSATLAWLVFLAGALILFADFTWSVNAGSLFARAMFLTFLAAALLYCLCLSFLFPLLARCENNLRTLLGMCFVLSIRNFLPVLTTVIVTVGIFAFGLFIFWPLLLAAPGLAAYINSFIFNRILDNYHLGLP